MPRLESAYDLLGVGAIAQHALPALGRSLQVGSPHGTHGLLQIPFWRWWKKVEEQGRLASFGKGAFKQVCACDIWSCRCSSRPGMWLSTPGTSVGRAMQNPGPGQQA